MKHKCSKLITNNVQKPTTNHPTPSKTINKSSKSIIKQSKNHHKIIIKSFLAAAGACLAAAGAFLSWRMRLLSQSVWRKVLGFTFWPFNIQGLAESFRMPVSDLKSVVWGSSYGHFELAIEFLAECAIYLVTQHEVNMKWLNDKSIRLLKMSKMSILANKRHFDLGFESGV